MSRQPTRVYVAGASAQLQRARRAMGWVREAPELTLAHDWTAQVQADREAGKQDADLLQVQQCARAFEDFAAIRESDIFWALVPQPDVRTTGLWVELGWALRARDGNQPIRAVCSGDSCRKRLFVAASDAMFSTDSSAFSHIRMAAR